MRTASWIVGLLFLLSPVSITAADNKSGIDVEGFVQQWLVLAPICPRSDAVALSSEATS